MEKTTINRPDDTGNKKLRLVHVISTIVAVICLTAAGLIWIENHRDEQAPLPTTLNVTSNPDGAQVFLAGELKGSTPLKLDLDRGKYEVRISLPNYYEWEAQVRLIKRGEMPLYVRLVPRE
ncbi:MAG: PEGA domain-containing protein [Deltaproteobacteria bacterium]|nr:PEGA domain-containing protein [Deltaproteobacteria bacterium]